MEYYKKYCKYKNKYKYLKNKLMDNKTGAGVINCEQEGFDENMRQASLGKDYPNSIVNHYSGEKDTYEDLVKISTNGLVDWYCKKAELAEDESTYVKNLEEVQILGAFFHRYKVFLEHIGKYIKLLQDGKKEELIKICQEYIEKVSQKYKLQIKKQFETIKYEIDNLITYYLTIETLIERVQCLLWKITKNKKLPDDFIMDIRITELARKSIEIYPLGVTFQDAVGYLSNDTHIGMGFSKLYNLIQKIIEINPSELHDIKFNVFT
jgi:hypothetical protein